MWWGKSSRSEVRKEYLPTGFSTLGRASCEQGIISVPVFSDDANRPCLLRYNLKSKRISVHHIQDVSPRANLDVWLDGVAVRTHEQSSDAVEIRSLIVVWL